jgi:hypothetical protein
LSGSGVRDQARQQAQLLPEIPSRTSDERDSPISLADFAAGWTPDTGIFRFRAGLAAEKVR